MALLLLLVVLLSFHHVPNAALIGIDLGSEFVKVAVIKSGSGLDVVLNEQTKRKTKAYVGFRNKERYFGEDAYNLHTRFPNAMITYLKHLVGVTADGTNQWKRLYRFPFFLLNATSRNTIKVHADEKAVYTAEELLGMFLAMLKDMAEKHSEQLVTDCMVAVPAAYTPRQLQAISDAAQLANLNVLSFIHDTTAAALQFGVQQRGFDALTNVAVFDVGSSKTEVGVFTFGPKAEEKKSKTFDSVGLGSLRVRAIESDMSNGGRVYDALLAEHLAKEFAKKSGVNVLEEENANGHKAVAKLMRTAQKVKETLSANKDAKASVEGIWEEADFNTVVLREEFESLVQPLFNRAIDVFKRAVAKSGLTMEEIDSVELMGGGSRIPALQTLLLEAFGKKQLGRTLNTDEAIALGATFHGARLSGAFRVRSFALVEHDARNVSFALSATPGNPQPAVRPLFLRGKYPTKKLVTVFRAQDFNVTVYEQSGAAQSGEDVPVPVQQHLVKGVAAAFAKMGATGDNINPESKQYVELKFRLADGGVVTLDSAVAKFDHVKNVTRLVKLKNATGKDLVASEQAGGQPAGHKDGEEEEEEAEVVKEGGEGQAEATPQQPSQAAPAESQQGTGATAPTGAADKGETVKEEPKFQQVNTTKLIHKKETLTTHAFSLGEPKRMAPRDFTDATYTLNRLKRRDAEKLEIAHAKNSLEAFIISMKYDGFFEDEGLKEYYDAAEAEAIRAAMTEVEDWMEQADGDATAAAYEQKLKKLKGLTDPILKRRIAKEKELFKKATEAEQPLEETEKPEAEGASAAGTEGDPKPGAPPEVEL